MLYFADNDFKLTEKILLQMSRTMIIGLCMN